MEELTDRLTDELIVKLAEKHSLSESEYVELIRGRDTDIGSRLAKLAVKTRKDIYSNDVFTRGLIEISNYCKNNCLYCGIRCGNHNAKRYRLTEEEILSCAAEGYELGFRTFVLQGGEDPYFGRAIKGFSMPEQIDIF